MQVLRRFKSDQRGATAMLFGLAVLPLIGLAGAAIDYSRAALEQTKLQRATDAAVLALVREPKTATIGELQIRAAALYRNFYEPASANGVVFDDPAVTRVGATLKVSRTGRVANAFGQVLGSRDTSVGASAEASWSMERIELALVLDNTGSMREAIGSKVKIEELRRASIDLLTRLRGIAASETDVRVSVVPFDTEVRLDPATYRNRDWLRFDSDRKSWTGYVVDRYQPRDVTDDAPVMVLPDTGYPALKVSQWRDSGQLAKVRPLTSLYSKASLDELKETIGNMQPRGNTNVGLGVSWGTATLTGSIPLDTPAANDSRKVKRYMVVLTDGDNTQNWVNGAPNSAIRSDGTIDKTIVAQITRRTTMACTTAKAADIEVFTIRLLAGDATMLGACASPANARNPQHYFDVQSETQLDAAFGSILNAISATRLTN